jgi:hypothetical protein
MFKILMLVALHRPEIKKLLCLSSLRMDPIFVKPTINVAKGEIFYYLQQNLIWQRVDNIAKVFRNTYILIEIPPALNMTPAS